jgi:hypothetical protein
MAGKAKCKAERTRTLRTTFGHSPRKTGDSSGLPGPLNDTIFIRRLCAICSYLMTLGRCREIFAALRIMARTAKKQKQIVTRDKRRPYSMTPPQAGNWF